MVVKASGFFPATVNGFTMTVATEIGDKTFCIAAIMAMKYNRLLIFFGAAGALLVMTVLSVVIGFALPSFLPKQYTHYAAAALFAYFGIKLLLEAREAPSESGEHSELAEAEEELALKLGGLEAERSKATEADALESGTVVGGPLGLNMGNSIHRAGNGSSTPSGSPRDGNTDEEREEEAAKSAAKSGSTKRNSEVGGALLSTLQRDWPIFTQAFMITFLAEWGDRSQIATIAMAAAQHPVGGT